MGNLQTQALISKVNDEDQVVGLADRAQLPASPTNFRVAHVFALNEKGEVLLQKIAPGQRSAGKWGSSAATYVLASETYRDAARRALKAEVGIQSPLRRIGKEWMPDLGARKFIEVYETQAKGTITPDATQVSAVEYFSIDRLKLELASHPSRYTQTFRRVFPFYLANRGA